MNKHNLYASCPIPDRAQKTKDLLKLLDAAFGIKTLGWVGKHGEIAVVHDAHYQWWTLADNGCEINVDRINGRPATQEWDAVPTSAVQYISPNVGTTAYRIARIITGDKIDWDWTFASDDYAVYLKE